MNGCTKDITKLNHDPKSPTTITYAALFTRAQQQLSNLLNTADYDFNPMNFFEQYWQERAAGNPTKRYGDPKELGAYCAFLCSAHAGYITGQNLVIDGGSYPGAF